MMGTGLALQIRQILRGGGSSIIVSVAATNALRVISSIVLTRLLTSDAYGVVGIITSVAFVMQMLSETGIVPFVVRHADGRDPRFLDEVWTIRLVRGVVLTIVMAILAGPIAYFIDKTFLTAAIIAWSFSFFLDGLSSLAGATGVRERQLWRLSLLDTATSAMTLVSSIAGALLLHSYWAMIIGMLAGQAARAALSYAFFQGAGRRIRISKPRSREIWAFSRNIALSSALSLFILQVDKLVLARMMPLAAFGLYAIALTLATAPEAVASPYCSRVLYPIYAAAAREARATFRSVYYGSRRRVALLYAFAVGGLIGGGRIVVEALYSPHYAGVALLLQIAAVRVLFRMPNLTAYEAAIALGQTLPGLIGNVIRGIWLLTGGAIALYYNSAMTMVIVVATDECPAMIWYWVVLKRNGLLRLREEILYFAVSGVGVAAGLGALMVWRWLFAGAA